jgi:hypothetical protein
MKTAKILVEQEREIIQFFNNKINEIKKQFEEERLKKGQKYYLFFIFHRFKFK